MRVSLITATYNRKRELMRGLYTILKQLVTPDEWIIVDDGSTDGTREYVKEKLGVIPQAFLKYIYLNHPEPRISCIPRNVGIRQAAGDVIIFTEPEALHVGNTIEQLLKKMEEHPNNTILASQVWTTQKLIAEALTQEDYENPERILKHKYAQLTTSNNPTNTNAPNSDWAITGELHCNAGVLFATRKEWLMELQGFNEEFIGHGFDDLDLFNRLALIGHGVLKCPDIAVIHQYHDKTFYPYNIYECAEKNGKISEAMIHAGKYVANPGKDWGTDA